jgi:hypothetical protein
MDPKRKNVIIEPDYEHDDFSCDISDLECGYCGNNHVDTCPEEVKVRREYKRREAAIKDFEAKNPGVKRVVCIDYCVEPALITVISESDYYKLLKTYGK